MNREMKKIVKCAVLLLAALLLMSFVCGLAYGVWRQGSLPLEVSEHSLPLDSGRDVMHVRLSNFSEPQVSGLQTMKMVNRSGVDLDEIVLRVFANGGESVGTGARAVDVTGVYVNDEAVSFAFNEEDPTVLRIGYAWASGEEIELRWHIRAPLSGEMTLIQLPVPAVWENGAWRTDAWDPLVQGCAAEAFDLEFWMEYNQDVDVHVSGAVLGYGDDLSGRIIHTRMSGARDAALLVTKGKAMRYREIGGVKVAALADGALAAERLLDQGEKALESLADAGFAYPFPALTIVSAETGYSDGYAASGMIVLPKEKDREAQLRRMTRLIARQIFGVLVGNDPWKEPWLSHTLASTAELLAYRAREGKKAFNTRFFEEIEVATRLTRPYGVSVGADVLRFGGDVEMMQVLRDQGAAMMLGVGEAIGYDALAQALCAYSADNVGKIADRQALEKALESVSGSSWTGYFEDELNY